MANLIGTAPNQVPTNGSLGTMAFRDAEATNIVEFNDYAEVAWNPSISNFTLGDGSMVGSYVRVGNLVTINLFITLGSTSSVSGQLVVPLPFNGVSQGTAQISYLENGVGYFDGSGLVTTSEIQCKAINAASTYATLSSTSSTVPFTWGQGDAMRLSYTYIAA